MSPPIDSAARLVELIRRKAPEYLDLLTASTDEEFDAAFEALLGPAIAHLETNKLNYMELDEEGLSAVLCASLSIPGLAVSQEKHSNGHVDLTIEAEHCVPVRRKLGEAKIYNGPVYHIGGLVQLLQRYATGREGRGILIAYVRKKNIAGLLAKIREQMNAELPCDQQGETTDHLHKWSFLSKHAHHSGVHLQVSHVGCNLFVERGSSTT
ncbi:hypothetical protein K0B96_08915 [Horticoccus luteus]|uniref:Uncharacterized protein n=1 Tax=Horticoccus luteus TaxID=2862869 RepID=A0A8F9U046_9BACT|nr:hypothetical protein [Horticoccus luteus]QYM80702.1 hypothetical protein K0B96_08915 [Horticoccus luteus]